MADTVGMQDIRGLNISKVVTGFALQEYTMKQLVTVQSSSNWQERYYQETAADLTGGTGSAVKGVPRLANFPHGEVSWTQQNSYHKKYGMETVISWEDANSNAVDVIARSLLRIARAVAKAVDSEIWNVLTENQSASNINSVTATAAWDAASGQDPIEDILEAKQKIAENNYNPDMNGYLVISPKDYKSLLTWLISTKGSSIPQFSSEKVENGKVGKLLGLTIVVSNSVTADYAAVVVAGECGTWKELSPLQTVTIEDQGVGYTIRSWEVGVCQLTNPKAVSLISNTQT